MPVLQKSVSYYVEFPERTFCQACHIRLLFLFCLTSYPCVLEPSQWGKWVTPQWQAGHIGAGSVSSRVTHSVTSTFTRCRSMWTNKCRPTTGVKITQRALYASSWPCNVCHTRAALHLGLILSARQRLVVCIKWQFNWWRGGSQYMISYRHGTNLDPGCTLKLQNYCFYVVFYTTCVFHSCQIVKTFCVLTEYSKHIMCGVQW